MSAPALEIKKSTEQRIIDLFLKKDFEKREYISLYKYTRLSHNLELTKHYNGHFPITRTPVFHPYNPTANPNPPCFYGIPGNTISVKFPNEFLIFLPDRLRKIILDLRIDPSKIDFFF